MLAETGILDHIISEKLQSKEEEDEESMKTQS
jgi:hypothetical protein